MVAKKCLMKELLSAIPSRYKRANNLISSAYLLWDIFVVGVLFYLGIIIFIYQLYYLLPIYVFVQGIYATALWVLAHECGHEALFTNKKANYCVGLVLHSLLLVPFSQWKYTHRSHHANIASLHADEVNVPKPWLKANAGWWDRFCESKVMMFVNRLFGLHAYLIFNVLSGDKYLTQKHKSHFDGKHPIVKKHKRGFYISNVCLFLVVLAAIYFFIAYSFIVVLALYVAPVLLASFFIAVITQLHHAGDQIEWFVQSKPLDERFIQTVDRKAGFFNLLNGIWHHICDTHVAHHLISVVPFYRAVKITAIIQPKMGLDYKREDISFFKAMLKYGNAVIRLKKPNYAYKAVSLETYLSIQEQSKLKGTNKIYRKSA